MKPKYIGKKRYKDTFTLTHDTTGQTIRALVIARSSGGRFMKIWQGTGWENRLDELQGNSLKVLYHLLGVATWQNAIPGPSEVARQKGKRQQHISRAYTDLLKAEFLIKRDHTYYLNPYFCWKGNDQQYEEMTRELMKPVTVALVEGLGVG